MTDIASLEAQAAQIAAQIKQAKTQARNDAIARINALLAEIKALESAHQLVAVPDAKPTAAARQSGVKGVPIQPKYRSPTGETWTGRGLQPRWLKAAVAGGATVESFRIAA